MYKRSITVGGEQITYNLSLKRIKSYNMRVHADGEIHVSAPASVTLASIDKFVAERVDFIHSARERVASRAESSPNLADVSEGSIHSVFGVPMPLRIIRGARASARIESGEIVVAVGREDSTQKRQRLLYRMLGELLYKTVCEMTERIYPLFKQNGVAYPEIVIRDMRSRWGSCNSTKGRIAYSVELIGARRELVEYVVMHEMCHLLHANHSADFYRELEARMPDWKQRKKELNGKG